MSAGAVPIITLLTDFGLRDAFVGTMKGVLLSRCPTAQLVDLTHALDLGDITGGALLLRAAVSFFPPGTIHLAVVDPGVGGPRRPLVLRAGSQFFVGPDNGLLWPAAVQAGASAAFELREERYRLSSVSSTFHGRDLFAPAAGALAAGTPPEAMGPPCSDPVTLSLSSAVVSGREIVGEVLWVDHFGNAITNLDPGVVSAGVGERFALRAGGLRLPGPSSHYGAVEAGQPVVVLGSMGYYEIAIREGNAADRLGLARGTRVIAEPSQ
jgi:S-adenosylmethionine hydrolase